MPRFYTVKEFAKIFRRHERTIRRWIAEGYTRHSSAIALRKYRTPEEIKRATMHATNKAFERYFQIESDDLREIYQDTKRKTKKGKVIKLS